MCPHWPAPTSAVFSVQDVIAGLRTEISKSFSMEIVMLVSWAIWATKNDFIIQGIPPSNYRCPKRFKDEMAMLVYKPKTKAYSDVATWVQNFI
jgi:hypothetical protein